MGVSVGETREQGRPIQVDDLQPLDRRRVGGGPDIGDPAVAGDDDLGGRRGLDARVDRPATDQQILRRRGQGQGGQGGGGQKGSKHAGHRNSGNRTPSCRRLTVRVKAALAVGIADPISRR